MGERRLPRCSGQGWVSARSGGRERGELHRGECWESLLGVGQHVLHAAVAANGITGHFLVAVANAATPPAARSPNPLFFVPPPPPPAPCTIPAVREAQP
jgi:hypothetical protein